MARLNQWVLGSMIWLVATSSVVWATAVDFTAQLRTRLELDARDLDSGTVLETFTLQRARLAARFEAASDVVLFVQVQDARAWGTETSTLRDASADNFDLHQGYFELANFLEAELVVRAGRMELIYGNERLVGAVGWSNTGRSFDGVVLEYAGETVALDVWATALRDSSTLQAAPRTKDNDRYFFGAYSTYDWPAGNRSEFAVLYDLDRDRIPTGPDIDDNRLSRFTIAANHSTKHRGFTATLEGAYQLGKAMLPDTTRGDIGAYFFAVNAGFAFADAWGSPWLGAGVDWLSGDDDVSDDELRSFNTLYATNHKWYGFMDYFPGSAGSLGLRDYHVKGKLSPGRPSSIALALHRFERDQGGTGDEAVFGHEIDSTVGHQINENFSLQAGYSVFIPGEVFKVTAGEDTAHWFYLMATANL